MATGSRFAASGRMEATVVGEEQARSRGARRWRVPLLGRFLVVCGVGNLVVHPILPWLLPALFFRTPRNTAYEFMIGGIYMAFGVAMIIAARRPAEHKLFIDAFVLANAFHVTTMTYFAAVQGAYAHFYGDILWFGLLALFPLAVYPWPLERFLRPADQSPPFARA
jgi:hypothetical protein